MKNKKLLFIGVLTAFLMLAVPFAVVSFDVDNVDATDGPDSTESGSETESNYIVAIGETLYESVQDAIDAAETSPTTIKFIEEKKTISGPGFVVNGENVIIDFNGCTYELTEPVGSTGTVSNGCQLLEGSTVKLMNGTLNVSSTHASEFYILIQNYSNLTIQDMTLDGKNLDKLSNHENQTVNGDSYVMSSNNGNVVITGNTSIIHNDEGSKPYAFDVCWFKGYDGTKVTFDSEFTGTVTGRISYSSVLKEGETGRTDNQISDKASLIIDAGTFNVTGCAFDGMELPKNANISVNGGTFNFSGGAEDFLGALNSGYNITISGLELSNDVGDPTEFNVKTGTLNFSKDFISDGYAAFSIDGSMTINGGGAKIGALLFYADGSVTISDVSLKMEIDFIGSELINNGNVSVGNCDVPKGKMIPGKDSFALMVHADNPDELFAYGEIKFGSGFSLDDKLVLYVDESFSICAEDNNNRFSGLQIIGVETDKSKDVTITGINSVGAGILVQKAGTVKITGCNISGITTETTIPGINGMFGGIGVQESKNVEITGNVIRNNTYRTYINATDEVNGAGNGIVVSVISGNVTVSGNTVDTVAYTAMYADNVVGSVTISGNIFEEWNYDNIHDGGRGIRATIVGSIDVNNNDFIKDYSSIKMNDIGNLFKVNKVTTEGKVKFYENRINGKEISINETIEASINNGFFFDADVSFDADSVSVVNIDAGYYYWSDVTITGTCHFPVQTNEQAHITVYGNLLIEKGASLKVVNITMTKDSKLDNKGSLDVNVIKNPENSDVIFRAGSKVKYGETGVQKTYSTDSRLLNSGGEVISSVDPETEKFESVSDTAKIDIGTQTSVTVENELTVELNVQDGNAGYTVLFPAGTVILKGAEVSIKEVPSESDVSMAMFEVHFKDIDTKGDIIQITLPTSGISNPYVFFVDDGEYVLMETVGEPGKMITFETTHNSKYAVISGDIASDFGFPEEDVSDGLDVNIIYIVELVLIALALLGLAAIIRRN